MGLRSSLAARKRAKGGLKHLTAEGHRPEALRCLRPPTTIIHHSYRYDLKACLYWYSYLSKGFRPVLTVVTQGGHSWFAQIAAVGRWDRLPSLEPTVRKPSQKAKAWEIQSSAETLQLAEEVVPVVVFQPTKSTRYVLTIQIMLWIYSFKENHDITMISCLSGLYRIERLHINESFKFRWIVQYVSEIK